MVATIKRWRLTFICSQNQSEIEGFGLARLLQPIQISRSISLLKSDFYNFLSDQEFLQKVWNIRSQNQSETEGFSLAAHHNLSRPPGSISLLKSNFRSR